MDGTPSPKAAGRGLHALRIAMGDNADRVSGTFVHEIGQRVQPLVMAKALGLPESPSSDGLHDSFAEAAAVRAYAHARFVAQTKAFELSETYRAEAIALGRSDVSAGLRHTMRYFMPMFSPEGTPLDGAHPTFGKALNEVQAEMIGNFILDGMNTAYSLDIRHRNLATVFPKTADMIRKGFAAQFPDAAAGYSAPSFGAMPTAWKPQST